MNNPDGVEVSLVRLKKSKEEDALLIETLLKDIANKEGFAVTTKIDGNRNIVEVTYPIALKAKIVKCLEGMGRYYRLERKTQALFREKAARAVTFDKYKMYEGLTDGLTFEVVMARIDEMRDRWPDDRVSKMKQFVVDNADKFFTDGILDREILEYLEDGTPGGYDAFKTDEEIVSLEYSTYYSFKMLINDLFDDLNAQS